VARSLALVTTLPSVMIKLPPSPGRAYREGPTFLPKACLSSHAESTHAAGKLPATVVSAADDKHRFSADGVGIRLIEDSAEGDAHAGATVQHRYLGEG
jgi:hypothetical protein